MLNSNLKIKTTFIIILLFFVSILLSACTKFPVHPVGFDDNKITTPLGVLKPISEKTIECIGKPSYLKTGFYNSEKEENYNRKTIIYYYEGDKYEETKKYFENKIKNCGYKKVSEETFNLNLGLIDILDSYIGDYERQKDNSEETLTFTIILQENNKRVTVVQLEKEQFLNEEYENTNEQNSQNSEEQNNNINYKDILLTGDVKKYDETFRRIIEEAIGKIHVESYGTAYEKLTYIKYNTEKTLDNTDVTRVADELKKAGYTISSVSVEEPEPTIMFYIEENKKMVVLTFETNYNTLELSVTTLN